MIKKTLNKLNWNQDYLWAPLLNLWPVISCPRSFWSSSRRAWNPSQSEEESRKLSKLSRKTAKGILYIHRFILFYSVCIIAADISPIDVLSHLPILCEEKGVPYIYVRSRAEVGEACKTKRPTSCVFIQAPGKKDEDFKKYSKTEKLLRSRNPYINWTINFL